MDAFMHIVREYGLGILLLAIWARMRGGGRNIRKYQRWDKIRAAKRLGKRRKK